MDKIRIDDLTGDNLVSGINYPKIHEASLIDTKKTLERPPTAISIGEITYGQQRYDCDFGTSGNFSCIIGASKSKKSFLKSLLIASYINGELDQAPNIKSHRKKDSYILDFDTEQGKWHSQRVFKRVISLAGEYEYYKPFYLRRYDYQERLQFIDWCIMSEDSPYYGNISFVSIDGFADLVKDVNDLVSCNELVSKMMKWTDVSGCHLTGILHQNYNSEKATGHLGSAIMKKAECVCSLKTNEDNKNYTTVSFPYTRGFPIEDFSFSIDDLGLPVVGSRPF